MSGIFRLNFLLPMLTRSSKIWEWVAKVKMIKKGMNGSHTKG